MTIEGFPTKKIPGALWNHIAVVSTKGEITEENSHNAFFVEKFPPEIGDEIFCVREGIKATTGYIFEKCVDPNHEDGQRWEFKINRQ